MYIPKCELLSCRRTKKRKDLERRTIKTYSVRRRLRSSPGIQTIGQKIKSRNLPTQEIEGRKMAVGLRPAWAT